MELQNICKKVISAAKETGEFIRKERTKFSLDQVQSKGLHDFVTTVDKASEDQLFKSLQSILPEAGFLGEEKTNEVKGELYNWIVDPLDGTTNFIHGLYPYAVSIALMKETTIVLGVVYEIGADEVFYAWKNSQAYCNNKAIRVSKTSLLKDSLIATGFPYSNFSKLESYMDSMVFFMKNTHGLRRLGSAAVDLAYLARGDFDGFYEYGLSPWDVAAGAFIVQQAGGKACDFSGGDNYIFGKEFLASNSNLHSEFYKVIHDFLAS
ncbi:MAG: inositol monophosphatase family protein [Bacteroidales bacterium]|nr:inositol monophosphatase family protein [Bacteroidales bacterium]